MYHFELLPNRRNLWEKEIEKFLDVFSKEDTFAPSCEISDEEKSYRLSLDIPGVDKESLNIEVKENSLFVTGERKFAGQADKDYVIRSERRYGKFSRVFSLPKNVDSDAIEARYENGVLDLLIPKSEKSLTRKIEISDWKKDVTTDLKN